MVPSVNPSTTGVFRLRKLLLDVGIFIPLAFVGMSVLAILDSRTPLRAAIFFGIIDFLFLLAGIALVRAYLRHRLIVAPDGVRLIGLLSDREVRFAKLTEVDWKASVRGGAVVLCEDAVRLKIKLENYRTPDQMEIVDRLRAARGSSATGLGGLRVRYRITPEKCERERAQIRHMLRFVSVSFALLIPVLYAIMIWARLNGAFVDRGWPFAAFGPLFLGGFYPGMLWWLAVRGEFLR